MLRVHVLLDGIFWFVINVKNDNSMAFETLDIFENYLEYVSEVFPEYIYHGGCREKGDFVLGLKGGF